MSRRQAVHNRINLDGTAYRGGEQAASFVLCSDDRARHGQGGHDITASACC